MLQTFRRAKVHLGHLDRRDVEEAIRARRPIEATVRLTDRKGGPLCASVKPEPIEWHLRPVGRPGARVREARSG